MAWGGSGESTLQSVATVDMFFEMPRMMQKRLDHTTQFTRRFGTIYFITICC
jgi:hypothetical protein